MVVEPSAFHTNFSNGAVVAARDMPEYAGTPGARPREMMRDNLVPRRGDPAKLVRNLLILLDGDDLPAHFPIGDEIYVAIERRESELRQARERLRPLATNVSLDEPAS
jgi:hypothetical protein